jgi:multicomponent Na+:H+ antiporter subunit C
VVIELVEARYVYLLVVLLLAVGLYGALAERNLVRKVIGLAIFKTAIFIFFIEGSVKRDATIPVIDPDIGIDPASYVNPLPHLLILTAIVVSVAVTGVAIALLIRVYQGYGTLDEDELVRRMGD